MNKLLAFFVVTTAVVAATPAIAADVTSETKTSVKQSDDGSVKKEAESKSTDAAGTTTKTDATVKTDVSSDGSKDTTATKETSTDPKGLGNKKTTKVKHRVKTSAKTGQTTTTDKKVVDGKTVQDTTSTTPAPAAQ